MIEEDKQTGLITNHHLLFRLSLGTFDWQLMFRMISEGKGCLVLPQERKSKSKPLRETTDCSSTPPVLEPINPCCFSWSSLPPRCSLHILLSSIFSSATLIYNDFLLCHLSFLISYYFLDPFNLYSILTSLIKWCLLSSCITSCP